MDKLLSIGRYLFPLSFLLYAGLHFGLPDAGAAMVPAWLPAPYFWNYFTGVLILAFIVSCLLGRFDKLSSVLMIMYVFLMIVIVHIPKASESENDMLNIFRNLMVIGALMIYARYVAKDNRIVH